MSTTAKRQLTVDEIASLAHNFIGPTWERNEDGSWHLPERTLGWEIAEWTAKYLVAEGGGPWVFTMEQLRFILWWYAVDKRGRFIYRRGGVLQRCKGWGKDPLLAVICLVELCGPSQFAGWGAGGQPLAKPHPRATVQVTAVNKAQTTNTMDFIPGLISERMLDDYGMRGKVGAEVIRANRGRQKLIAVTSNYRALEGKRTTFTLLNETHHWVLGNQGHKMFETITANASKMGGRFLAITNAYLPGEDSVAERMRAAWQKTQDGRAEEVGSLYDSIEAHPLTPLTRESLEIVLPIIRGDAFWLQVENVIDEVLDTTIGPSRSRRMWFNQIVAEDDALYGPEHFEAIKDEQLMLQRNDEIVLGFDGGKTDDSTALVAIRVRDRAAFLIGLWERPEGPLGEFWEVDKQAVDSAVHETFRLHNVVGFYADVALWETQIDNWAETYREQLRVKASERQAVAWDMRQSNERITRAHERLVQAIFDAEIKYDGDNDLTRHALNVRRHNNQYGVSFRKESRESPKKIDAYAALLLAHEALHDLRTRGKKPKAELTGEVWAF